MKQSKAVESLSMNRLIKTLVPNYNSKKYSSGKAEDMAMNYAFAVGFDTCRQEVVRKIRLFFKATQVPML